MIQARDGSLEDRALVKPDRNNWAPRLGFAWSVTPRTVVRGAYGISYIHFHRAGRRQHPVHQRAAGDHGRRLADQPARRRRSGRREQGYPGGLTDPSRFDPLLANITYMPSDYHSSRVQSWFVSVQRELFRNTVLDVAYVGNQASDLLLFANFNQARPNHAAGRT